MSENPDGDEVGRYASLVARHPENPEYRSQLGNALSYQERYEEAIEQWLEAIRLNPKDDHVAFCISFMIGGPMPMVKPRRSVLRLLSATGNDHYLAKYPPAEVVEDE
jgi:tetratricopeptide (TPR) repeat protein